MTPRKILPSLLIALLLSTCAWADVTLGAQDNGKTLTVTPGTKITVQLESNPTTGYQWTLPQAPDSKVVKKLSSALGGDSPQVSKEPIAGAPGIETWVFQATGAGQTKVTMTYMRTFAPKDHPSDFSFTVIVNP